MATAVQTTGKFLAYDGDCPMCTSTIGLLLRWKLVSTQQARSNHDLHGQDLDDVRAAGIRNQLVVLDPATRETRAGAPALLWIIGDNLGHPWWVRLLGLPGMRQLVQFGYETVSYNRRIISPPRHQIVCDCEPEVTLARRLMLIVPASLKAALFTALLCLALVYRGEQAWPGVALCLAIGSAGWLLLGMLAAVLLPREKSLDYVAHLAFTSVMGSVAPLVASPLVALLPTTAALAVAGVALGGSFAVMFRMQRKRVAALRLSRLWLAGWAVLAGLSAGGMLYTASQLI